MPGPHPLLELLSVTAGLTYHHLAGGPRKVNLFGKDQLAALGLVVNAVVLCYLGWKSDGRDGGQPTHERAGVSFTDGVSGASTLAL